MYQNKVLWIVIDGCRPDGISEASTPNLDRLMEDGAYSMQVETVSPPLTLPAHFSIFASRQPINHNVMTNCARPEVSPDIFSIFEAAKYKGLSTAAFYSWEQLRNLTPPGVLDQSVMLRSIDTVEEPKDVGFTRLITPSIVAAVPDFCFVYLEGVDTAGHKHGWMSDDYLAAIGSADKAVGYLLDSLEDNGLKNSYNIMIFSDHGGLGRHHMESVPEVLTVPLILAGPDINQRALLETHNMNLLDIAPTTAALLGIVQHWSWEGRILNEIVTKSYTSTNS